MIGPVRAATKEVERLFATGGVAGLSERQLLERFIARRDEAAFEALVARHGPMVLGICRRLLRDPNDVDDAFQATFLVLVRKASTLQRRELLGNWLYGVASRVAQRARVVSARRSARETSGVEELTANDGDALGRDLHGWLGEEIGRLPEKYRAPVVLCYLEGLTHDEAAARLGWPVGSVKGRLARARDLLKTRLTRRGLTAAGAATLLAEFPRGALAAVPAPLFESTLRATSGLTGAGAGPILALAEGVVCTMWLSKLKSIGVVLAVASLLVTAGVAVRAYQAPAPSDRALEELPDPTTRTAPADRVPDEQFSNHGDALAQGTDPPKGTTTTVVEVKAVDSEPQKPRGRNPGAPRGLPPGPMPGRMAMTGGAAGSGLSPEDQVVFKLKMEAGIRQEIAVLSKRLQDATPGGRAILAKLEEPVEMSFANETPFEDVLKYIRSATKKGDKDVEIPIYVDPEGLQLAEKTMQSPIVIDLQGIPLKVTLRLLLRQIGLAYCVKDGVLLISDPRIIQHELQEMQELAEDNKRQ